MLNNGAFCWSWFGQHWSNLFQPALIQHIELTAIAVAIGFAISFSLAVLAHRRRWLIPPVTFVTSVLFTIPSLAAFEILVPITGLTWTSIEIPLVSYTLLVLFNNILAGLSGVSAEVRDAATGIGLTQRQIPIPIGSQYEALDQGKVDSIAVFTTDPQLLSNRYTVLTDPKGIFGFQQVVPVVKTSLLNGEGPAIPKILDAVSAKLTDNAVQQMDKAVEIGQQNAATVAKQFLQANGLD